MKQNKKLTTELKEGKKDPSGCCIENAFYWGKNKGRDQLESQQRCEGERWMGGGMDQNG